MQNINAGIGIRGVQACGARTKRPDPRDAEFLAKLVDAVRNRIAKQCAEDARCALPLCDEAGADVPNAFEGQSQAHSPPKTLPTPANGSVLQSCAKVVQGVMSSEHTTEANATIHAPQNFDVRYCDLQRFTRSKSTHP